MFTESDKLALVAIGVASGMGLSDAWDAVDQLPGDCDQRRGSELIREAALSSVYGILLD